MGERYALARFSERYNSALDGEWGSKLLGYDELDETLRGDGLFKFYAAMEIEIEHSVLFAAEKLGEVARDLERCFGGPETLTGALKTLKLTLRFVELSLVGVRRLLSTRDNLVASGLLQYGRPRDDEGTQALARQRRRNWFARTSRASVFKVKWRPRSLEALEALADVWPALLIAARRRKVSATLLLECEVASARAKVAVGRLHERAVRKQLVDSDEAYAEEAFTTSHLQKFLRKSSQGARQIILKRLRGGRQHLLTESTTTDPAAEPLVLASALATATHGATAPKQQQLTLEEEEEEEAAAAAATTTSGGSTRSIEVGLVFQYTQAFLFAGSLYTISPTAVHYLGALGAHKAYASLLIGATSLASLASTPICAFLGRRAGYKFPMVLGSAMCCAANVLYASVPRLIASEGGAEPKFGPLTLGFIIALLGRLGLGLGSAEPVNRAYLASVPLEFRVAAAARYVSAAALGQGFGPFVAASFGSLVPAAPRHVRDLRLVSRATAPTLFFAALFALHGLAVLFFFQDDYFAQQAEKTDKEARTKSSMGGRAASSDTLNDAAGVTAAAAATTPNNALLEEGKGPQQHQEEEEEEKVKQVIVGAPLFPPVVVEDEETESGASQTPSLLLGTTMLTEEEREAEEEALRRRAVRKPLGAALTSVVVLEFVRELLLASTATLCLDAFKWKSKRTGALLGALCTLTVPSAALLERLSESVDDRSLLNLATCATLVGVVVMLSWPLNEDNPGISYIAASAVVFLGTAAMEPATMAIVANLSSSDAAGLSVTLLGVLGSTLGDLWVFAAVLSYPTDAALVNLTLWGPTAGLLALLLLIYDRAFQTFDAKADKLD